MTKEELLTQINRGRHEFFSDDPQPFFLRGYPAWVDYIDDPDVTAAARRLFALYSHGSFGIYGGHYDGDDPLQDRAIGPEAWEAACREWDCAYEDY